MGNDIRENAIVQSAINAAKVLEGDKSKIDTPVEVQVFKSMIEINKAFLEEVDYKKALGLYQTTTSVLNGQEQGDKNTNTVHKINTIYEEEFKKAVNEGNYNLEAIVLKIEKMIDELPNKKSKKSSKEVLSYLEKTTIKSQAQAYVKEAIESVLKTEKDKEYAIQDKAIEYLKQNGMWNKYTEKEISRANLLKDSYGETLIEKQQLRNRIANKKVQSDADIKKMLNDGKNDYHLIAGLEKAGLVSAVDKDGNRDLSELSQVIRDFLGSDFTRSHAAKEVKVSDEMVSLRAELKKRTGVDYNNRQTRALIKLCGYRNDDFASLEKIAKNTLIGTAIGAVGGAIDNLFSGKTRIKEGDVNVTNTVELNIKGSGIEDIDLGKFDGSVQIDKTTGLVKILIEEFIKVPGGVVELGHSIGSAALRGALVGGCLGALGSLAPDKEVQVIPEPNANDTMDSYLDRLSCNKESKYDYYIDGLAYALYDESIKDEKAREEKWNKDFNALIDFLGGNNGIVNKDELLNVSEKDLTAFIETLGIGKTETSCQEPACTATADEKIENVSTNELDNLIHNTEYGDTWKGLVEAYYPGLVEKCGGLYGKNGAIKALQKALCTDIDGNFDQVEFKKLINEKNLRKEIKLPTKVNSIQRVKGEVKKVDFKPEELATTNTQGKTIGYDQYKVSIKQVPAGWVVTDDCTNATASGLTPGVALAKLKDLTKKTYSNEEEIKKLGQKK